MIVPREYGVDLIIASDTTCSLSLGNIDLIAIAILPSPFVHLKCALNDWNPVYHPG